MSQKQLSINVKTNLTKTQSVSETAQYRCQNQHNQNTKLSKFIVCCRSMIVRWRLPHRPIPSTPHPQKRHTSTVKYLRNSFLARQNGFLICGCLNGQEPLIHQPEHSNITKPKRSRRWSSQLWNTVLCWQLLLNDCFVLIPGQESREVKIIKNAWAFNRDCT